MSNDALTELLEAWCGAILEAEAAREASPERAIAEDVAQRLNLEIRAHVLRLTGHRDQVDAAIDASIERLMSSRQTLDGAWTSKGARGSGASRRSGPRRRRAYP